MWLYVVYVCVCVCVPDVPVCGMSGRLRPDIPQTGTSGTLKYAGYLFGYLVVQTISGATLSSSPLYIQTTNFILYKTGSFNTVSQKPIMHYSYP
jgi:hypothetical protein